MDLNEKTRHKYDKVSGIYDIFEQPMEWLALKNWRLVLKEIRRVCKPDGKIIMIEHVRSEKKVIGALMDLLNPVIVSLYGANINRRTIDNIKTAGFIEIEEIDLMGDIVKKIEIDNIK